MFQGRPQPEVNFDKLLAQMKKQMSRFFRRIGGGGAAAVFLGILGLLVAIWLATGFYQVRPAQMAALRLFGKVIATDVGPGLHWYWPRPVGIRNIEAVTETRRMEVGFRSVGGQTQRVSGEALMITGDLNIVDVELVVQYRIGDLTKFLFRVADPGDPTRETRPGVPEGLTLRDAAEAALRQVVGQRSIDDAITINREAVQADTHLFLQNVLNEYNTGIEVLNVQLQSVRPPDPVRDAFDDVVRGRVDKEARINQALAYQQDQLPRARGDAQKILNAAEGYRQERILKATGEAGRFLANLKEYSQARDVTRQRLYLEAMEEVLPGVTKFIVSPEAGGNLLQFLPLEKGPEAQP